MLNVVGDVQGKVLGGGASAITGGGVAVASMANASITSATFASGATLPVVNLANTVTTYTGNTPQTGDAYARLGAPTGASIAADIQTRSTYAGGAVASVTAPVTVGTNSDKSGYSLATAPPTAAAIATAVWTDATSGDFTVSGTPGKVLVGQLGGSFSTATSSVFTIAALANGPSGTGGSFPSAAPSNWLTAAAFATDAISSAAVSAAAVAKVQSGLATPTNITSGSITTVTSPVTISLSQAGLSPRALDAVADSALTVGDALVAALCVAAGKESVSGTAYTVKTPSTGTVIRTFSLDSGTNPTTRS